MKLLLLLLLVISCSTKSQKEYRANYHVGDHKNAQSPEIVHALLKDKMTKCYPQSNYPLYEKTIGKFHPETNSGTVIYQIDNQTMGPRPVVLVDVLKDEESKDLSSLVRVYSKGDIFHPGSVYLHHIQKWLDGLKVDCHAQGDI